jgi:hypothetical protein
MEFIEGKLELNEDNVETDKLVNGDIRTGRKLTKIANSISPIIQVEEDVSSYNENKKLLILDLKVWPEEERINMCSTKSPWPVEDLSWPGQQVLFLKKDPS